MSMMKCEICHALVDTDSDPDSLYVPGRECVCEECRDSGEYVDNPDGDEEVTND